MIGLSGSKTASTSTMLMVERFRFTSSNGQHIFGGLAVALGIEAFLVKRLRRLLCRRRRREKRQGGSGATMQRAELIAEGDQYRMIVEVSALRTSASRRIVEICVMGGEIAVVDADLDGR